MLKFYGKLYRCGVLVYTVMKIEQNDSSLISDGNRLPKL